MTPNTLPGAPPCSTGFPVSLDVAGSTEDAGRRVARRRTLLRVDDDRVILDLQRALLEAAGFAVETTDDPHEALRNFARNAPDAVVMDFAMPSMSGGVLAARMRRLCSGIPLVLNSGSSAISPEEAALFDRHLAKGLAPTFLIAALRELLGTANERVRPEPKRPHWPLIPIPFQPRGQIDFQL
jgi:CheY-like chemotaxis protein